LLAVLICSLGCVLDCGANAETDAGEGGAALSLAGSSSAPPSEADLIEQLSAIGYLAGTEQAHHFPGVTLHVIREYTGPKSEPLHSRRSGRVQLLPNGNTLVVETDRGRALELAEDGEVVWEFRSPYLVGERAGKVASLYSLERVGEGQASWLDSKKKSTSQ
jgi:hypothetical protein